MGLAGPAAGPSPRDWRTNPEGILESRRDSETKPKVARNELPWVGSTRIHQLRRSCAIWLSGRAQPRSRLMVFETLDPRVARGLATLGCRAIPSGLPGQSRDGFDTTVSANPNHQTQTLRLGTNPEGSLILTNCGCRNTPSLPVPVHTHSHRPR